MKKNSDRNKSSKKNCKGNNKNYKKKKLKEKPNSKLNWKKKPKSNKKSLTLSCSLVVQDNSNLLHKKPVKVTVLSVPKIVKIVKVLSYVTIVKKDFSELLTKKPKQHYVLLQFPKDIYLIFLSSTNSTPIFNNNNLTLNNRE